MTSSVVALKAVTCRFSGDAVGRPSNVKTCKFFITFSSYFNHSNLWILVPLVLPTPCQFTLYDILLER